MAWRSALRRRGCRSVALALALSAAAYVLLVARRPVLLQCFGVVRRDEAQSLLYAATGLNLCGTTWPGMGPAPGSGPPHCPWLEGWPDLPPAGAAGAASGIAVSLTTFSARWERAPALLLGTLWSLLSQTLPPDVILLNVPASSPKGVDGPGSVALPPAAVALLSTIPRVRVVWAPEYGPATKLLPALTSTILSDDTAVFVCDDDRRYPPTLLEELHRWLVAPGYTDAVLGTWGEGAAGSIHSQTVAVVDAKSPAPVGLLLGVSGFMLRRGLLSGNLTTFLRAPPGWRDIFWPEDDNWLACVAARLRVPMFVVPGPFRAVVDFGGDTDGCQLDSGACLHAQPGNVDRYAAAVKLQKTECLRDWCDGHLGACGAMYG